MNSYLFIYREHDNDKEKFYRKLDDYLDKETKTCCACGHTQEIDQDFEAGKALGKYLTTNVPCEFWDGLKEYFRSTS